MKRFILIRVWYEDGYYEEKKYDITYNDYQITNNEKHGKVTDFIIDLC